MGTGPLVKVDTKVLIPLEMNPLNPIDVLKLSKNNILVFKYQTVLTRNKTGDILSLESTGVHLLRRYIT